MTTPVYCVGSHAPPKASLPQLVSSSNHIHAAIERESSAEQRIYWCAELELQDRSGTKRHHVGGGTKYCAMSNRNLQYNQKIRYVETSVGMVQRGRGKLYQCWRQAKSLNQVLDVLEF